MKIRYINNKNKRQQHKLNKLRAKRNRVALWHRKFAWRPLKITTPKDSTDYSTVILFEWVMQKAQVRDYQYRSIRKFIWTRYPEKEYFRKKLDGTLEKEERFGHFTNDEASAPIQSGPNASVTSPRSTKLGGPAK